MNNALIFGRTSRVNAYGRLPLCTILLCLAVSARAQIMYDVTVNTTTIAGQSGYFDIQFDPDTLDSLPASIGISEFTSDSVFTGGPTVTGDVIGTLPGQVTLNNDTPFNDLFQSVTFGNSTTFETTLYGPAFNPLPPYPSGGSTFSMSLYASDGVTPLLTTDPGGSILYIDVNPDGSTVATNFPSDFNGGASVTTFGTVVGTAVPEPSALTNLYSASVWLAASIVALRLGRYRRFNKEDDISVAVVPHQSVVRKRSGRKGGA
jgi:hypothetical protein